MSDQAKISIIRALLLLLLGAVFVVNPHIEVKAPLDILSILELNLEPSMSKPFAINLTLQSLMHKRPSINLGLRGLSLFKSLSLLWGHLSHHLGQLLLLSLLSCSSGSPGGFVPRI